MPVIVRDFLRGAEGQHGSVEIIHRADLLEVARIDILITGNHLGQDVGWHGCQNPVKALLFAALQGDDHFAGGWIVVEFVDEAVETNVGACGANRLFQSFDDGFEATLEVAEGFAANLGVAAVDALEHAAPQPGHGDLVVVAVELALQQRLPDDVGDGTTGIFAQPFQSGHARQFPPVALALQPQHGHAGADAVEEADWGEADQVDRAFHRIQRVAVIGRHGRFVVGELVFEAKFFGQGQDELIGLVEEVVGLLHPVSGEVIARGQTAEAIARLEDGDVGCFLRQFIGGGEAREAASDDADTWCAHGSGPLARCLGC